MNFRCRIMKNDRASEVFDWFGQRGPTHITGIVRSFPDLIHRFSKDIDLIPDWRLVGCGKNEPWAERSKNQQDKFDKVVNARAEPFLAHEYVPKLEADFCSLLDDVFLDQH